VHRIAALIALAALSSATLAQPGDKTQIVIGVRPWGSPPLTPFVERMDVVHPDFSPVEVEVGVMYYRDAGYGVATVVHNIVGSPYDQSIGDSVQLLDRTDSSLNPDGRVGNFNYGGQFQAIYNEPLGDLGFRFRIGANSNPNDVPAGGISIKQNTPVALGAIFVTEDRPLGYHFKLTVACDPSGAPRTMTLDAPRNKVNSFTVYSTSQSTTAASIIDSLIDSRVATVTISAPAPASLALLLAPLLAPRRRTSR